MSVGCAPAGTVFAGNDIRTKCKSAGILEEDAKLFIPNIN
jgi:hypothetical protein